MSEVFRPEPAIAFRPRHRGNLRPVGSEAIRVGQALGAMGRKPREVIRGDPVMGADNAPVSRGRPQIPHASRAGAYAWRVGMEGYGGPSRPSVNASTADTAGLRLSTTAARTRTSLPLNGIRQPRDTPIWKLETALKRRSCREGRYAPPVHMIKLAEAQEIAPDKWLHSSEER
jgi:hypothetical protein